MTRVAFVVLVAVSCGKPAPARLEPTWKAPSNGPFAIPSYWAECTADADCTVASLGCCDVTPVNRRHLSVLKGELALAHRRYCPPKDACGPGASGAWDGEPGACSAGACVVPPWPK